MSGLGPLLARSGRTAAAIAAAGVLAAGCGKPVLRIADASLGDYYTEEEYQKLREDQREEYCRALAEQDSIYREEIGEARAEAAMHHAHAAAASAERDSLLAVAASLESDLAAARAGAGPGAGAAPADATSVVTVRAGDSLWRISGRAELFGDPRQWPRLYEANRDRIRDADLIHPGQELRVPR
ncbi:MAG TPA: LysM peptidoglycan-binding domain-containing protein [Candidatus Eisenbacteria bacterium]|nr:LysM peptidoglycan-binding domain-containing protein [Candidatus Eisenbacteria bacterium]